MRQSAPALLPILRSQVQGQLLALLYLHPDDDYSLTEIAARIGASVAAVQVEASRLVAGGLVYDRRRGRLRLLSAATDTAVARPLTDLLAVTYGPLPVLADVFSEIDGITQAFIYGSWAARYRGETGPPPRDVDVLVIGTAAVDELFAAAREAEKVLARDVHIGQVTVEQWVRAFDDPFLAGTRSRPLVEVVAPTPR